MLKNNQPQPPSSERSALEKELHRSQRLLDRIEANMSPAQLQGAQEVFKKKLERARAAKFS